MAFTLGRDGEGMVVSASLRYPPMAGYHGGLVYVFNRDMGKGIIELINADDSIGPTTPVAAASAISSSSPSRATSRPYRPACSSKRARRRITALSNPRRATRRARAERRSRCRSARSRVRAARRDASIDALLQVAARVDAHAIDLQNVIAGLQLPLLRRGSWQHAIDGRDVVAEHVANAEESVVGLRALHIAGHDAIRRAVRTVIESATCIAISVVARASPDATPAIVQTTATVPRPRLRSFGSNASRRRTGVPRDDGSGFISGSGVLSTDISISSLMVLSFSMRRALLECHREIREVFVRNRPRTRPRKIVEHQPAW